MLSEDVNKIKTISSLLFEDQENEVFIKNVFDLMPVGITIANANGDVIYVNKALEKNNWYNQDWLPKRRV